MKIHLITTYYKAGEGEREKENLFCLKQNIENSLISGIHLFLQGDDKPDIQDSNKIHLISHNRRPTFSELFKYANELGSDVIKIVANSDIYFDDSLTLTPQALRKWNVLALTRWDRLENANLQFFRNFKSQDTWIFSDTIPYKSIGNFFIGQYGCDNRLLYEFKQIGFKIGNPSFSIITIHVHLSGLRSYFNDPNYKYVQEPYGYLTPHYLNFNFGQFINEDFIALKYQYFKSCKNNSLFSVKFNLISRFIAFFKMKFYAFLINRLN